MKKFFAMLLSLVMILSLSVPAFAAETDIVTSTEENKNTATHNVTASYTPSSTEDTTPTITGVSLSGTGVTYDETTKTYTVAHDATDIVLTVTGTNFINLTADYQVKYCTLTSPLTLTTATVDATANTVTYNLDAGWFAYDVNDKYEINYSSDGGTSWNSLGVYVIYDDGISEEDRAVITGLSITVDGTEYTSGTAVITPNTQSIIITVTGTKLNNATARNGVTYYPGRLDDLTYGWTVSEDGSSATMSLTISDFENITTANELGYTNDMGTTSSYTGIYVIYQSKIVSVDITWGAMSFTYDDTVDEGENGWTCAEGANKITVANNSTVAVGVDLAYTPADGYDWLGGYFEVADGFDVADYITNIPASDSDNFYLILASDKPEAAFSGTVGTVTVTIIESESPTSPGENTTEEPATP